MRSLQPPDEYLLALGRACFNFAVLQWQVGMLTFVLDAGRHTQSDADLLTAGKAASRLRQAIKRNANETLEEKKALLRLKSRFMKLTILRDHAIHGTPYVEMMDGAYQLGRFHVSPPVRQTAVDLEAYAVQFEQLATEVESAWHGRQPWSQA